MRVNVGDWVEYKGPAGGFMIDRVDRIYPDGSLKVGMWTTRKDRINEVRPSDAEANRVLFEMMAASQAVRAYPNHVQWAFGTEEDCVLKHRRHGNGALILDHRIEDEQMVERGNAVWEF